MNSGEKQFPFRIWLLGIVLLVLPVLACDLILPLDDFFSSSDGVSAYDKFEDCVTSSEEQIDTARDRCVSELTEEERIQMRNDVRCLGDPGCQAFIASLEESLDEDGFEAEEGDSEPEFTELNSKETTSDEEVVQDCQGLTSEECLHIGIHQYTYATEVMAGDCTPDTPTGTVELALEFGPDGVRIPGFGDESGSLPGPKAGPNVYAELGTDCLTGSPTELILEF